MKEQTFRVGVFDGEKFNPVYVKAESEAEARELAENPTLVVQRPRRDLTLGEHMTLAFGRAKPGLAGVAVRVR